MVDAAVQKSVENKPTMKAMKEEVKKDAETTLIKSFGTADEVFPFDRSGEFYYGGMQDADLDLRKDSVGSFKEAYNEFRKYTYTQTGGAGTAGYALIPVYVDTDIQDRTRREIPFIEMLPRRAIQGLTYDYNAITTLTNAVALAEDADLADLTDVYDRFSTAIKFLYSTGRVTGPAIAARRGYVDALQLEVRNRTIGMKRYEDQQAIIGPGTGNTFSGLITQITTNSTNLAGALTIDAMRSELTTCYDAGGITSLILTTKSVEQKLKGLLMDYQRWVDTTKIAWGIETMTFDGVPVVVDRYVTSGYMLFLDMSTIFMAVLQDIVYDELAHTNDSIKFTLKCYEALVMRAESFCSELYGIA